MSRIQQQMPVSEILEQFPETLDVFRTIGFEAKSVQDLEKEMGNSFMLQTLLKVKGINIPLFIEQLETKIEQNQEVCVCGETGRKGGRLDFLGYTVCPMKQTFRECFEETVTKPLELKGKVFDYFIPSGCGGQDDYESLWMTESLDDFPNALVSVGFGDFFRKGFVDRFVANGCFKAVKRGRINETFRKAGFEDPRGWYTVYAVYPIVFLIDKRRLGNLPVPRKWSDILKPDYRKNIITTGKPGDISEVVLLYLYKEFGEEGIRKLAGNVKDAWHSSKMAKTAGTMNSEGAAVYLAPWFFARSCPRTEAVEVIWPEDGAITSPMYLLVKSDKMDRVKEIAEFVTGVTYGEKSAGNYYPVLNPLVDNGFPGGASLKWLGWEFIHSQDLHKLRDEAQKLFDRHWIKDGTLEENAL